MTSRTKVICDWCGQEIDGKKQLGYHFVLGMMATDSVKTGGWFVSTDYDQPIMGGDFCGVECLLGYVNGAARRSPDRGQDG